MTSDERRARMAELLPRVETDRAALVEYGRLWMAASYSGSPWNRKPHEVTTGP
ncbi:hypothetical protein [Deinococcus hopiensis]|uniref:Uncharacterized protein n=1 Tax=Deinococcus hopiensis KR-140 TaxID=695939 RepID=A0A1W1VCX9_9DEIO|nr:hypothetical protein [Deinococcus hopiensis]SMB91176.1 hypothetical protein SAMN00790413_01022 [Deinococcus hopiensis KR-140]